MIYVRHEKMHNIYAQKRKGGQANQQTILRNEKHSTGRKKRVCQRNKPTCSRCTGNKHHVFNEKSQHKAKSSKNVCLFLLGKHVTEAAVALIV